MSKKNTAPPADVETLLARAAGDPALFGASFLGNSYTPDQLSVMDAIKDHDRVAVHSGHATGKSFVAAAVAMWFLHSFKPSKVITTAPTWRQVNEILWSEIRAAHARAVVPLGSYLPPRAPEMRVSQEHFALGVSTNEPARLQGFHSPNQLIILDEAAGISGDIWDAVEYIASGGAVKILAIGNPEAPDGPFYSACTSPLWKTICISCLTHPNISGIGEPVPGAVTPGWVEGRALEWGPESPLYKARVCGEFPEEGEDTLIRLRWVLEAVNLEGPEDKLPPVIGCDVARFGQDETVIVVLEQGRVKKISAYTGRDLMQTCGEIIRIKRERGMDESALVVVDDVGLGGGVTDRLREQGHRVLAFKGGGKARDAEQFVNRRAESFWYLREELRLGRLSIPDDDLLKSQLTSIRYRPRSDGRIELEKKDEMLRRGMPSPDRADALCMALWGRKRAIGGVRPSALEKRNAAEPRKRGSLREAMGGSGGTLGEAMGKPDGPWGM